MPRKLDYIERHSQRGKLICAGDEAAVRHLESEKPSLKGLVERREEIPKQFDRFSMLFLPPENEGQKFNPLKEQCHLARYHSLKLAHALFPENFIEVKALRFRRNKGRNYAYLYSKFEPDETGVIERRKKNMKKYYALESKIEREKLVTKADKIELGLNPEIKKLAKKAERGGIGVPHPEANYHVSGGKTKFIEVTRVDYDKALKAIEKLPKKRREKALFHLAGVYSAHLKETAILLKERNTEGIKYRPMAKIVYEISDLDLTHLVFNRLKENTSSINNRAYNFLGKRLGQLFGNPGEDPLGTKLLFRHQHNIYPIVSQEGEELAGDLASFLAEAREKQQKT